MKEPLNCCMKKMVKYFDNSLSVDINPNYQQPKTCPTAILGKTISQLLLTCHFFLCSGGGMPEKGKRVTMMFSATFPSEVQELARGKCRFHPASNCSMTHQTILNTNFLKISCQMVRVVVSIGR